MTRLRTDNVFGTLTNNPLTNVATTMNGAGLANLAAVASPNYAVITLDPNRVNGAPEIIYVTAHTGSATSATILRGREGTAAREHPAGTFWTHALTAIDFASGEIGYAQVSASQTGITTETDLTGLSAPVTVGTDRRIRITGFVPQFLRTAGTVTFTNLHIYEGASQLNLVTVGMNNTYAGGVVQWVGTPSAGAHTYKLRAGGDGTRSMQGGTTQPAFILVEDIGPVRTVQPV